MHRLFNTDLSGGYVSTGSTCTDGVYDVLQSLQCRGVVLHLAAEDNVAMTGILQQRLEVRDLQVILQPTLHLVPEGEGHHQSLTQGVPEDLTEGEVVVVVVDVLTVVVVVVGCWGGEGGRVPLQGEGGGGVLAMSYSGQLILPRSPPDTQLSPFHLRSCSMRQRPHPSKGSQTAATPQ